MIDAMIAKKIRDAAKDFNEGLELAAESGLKVDFVVHEIHTIGRHSHEFLHVERIQKIEATDL